MDEDEVVAANTEAEETYELRAELPVRRWGSLEGHDEIIRPGREIDVRPDPAGVRAAESTQALRWPEGHTTGAFVSAAASIRHQVSPYKWYDRISPGMLALWVGFVGLPVGAGIWAGIVLWGRLHHGS